MYAPCFENIPCSSRPPSGSAASIAEEMPIRRCTMHCRPAGKAFALGKSFLLHGIVLAFEGGVGNGILTHNSFSSFKIEYECIFVRLLSEIPFLTSAQHLEGGREEGVSRGKGSQNKNSLSTTSSRKKRKIQTRNNSFQLFPCKIKT